MGVEGPECGWGVTEELKQNTLGIRSRRIWVQIQPCDHSQRVCVDFVSKRTQFAEPSRGSHSLSPQKNPAKQFLFLSPFTVEEAGLGEVRTA